MVGAAHNFRLRLSRRQPIVKIGAGGPLSEGRVLTVTGRHAPQNHVRMPRTSTGTDKC